MGITTETQLDRRAWRGGRVERREKARISLPFTAKVVGSDADGRAFETATVLDNLSANGAYFRMPVRVSRAAKLLVTVTFGAGAEAENFGLEFSGSVVRIEPAGDGRCGVALHFSNSIFL